MRVLLIGGTGLISTGIVKHLLTRGAEITLFNRGQRENTLPPGPIHTILGNRDDFPAFEQTFRSLPPFDAVIDMICFTPQQAESDVRAFAGRCQHFLFCSTVCTYGTQIPPHIVVDETFPQQPTSTYGKNKLACEQIFLSADRAGHFRTTIIRPSHTYGPGSPLIDNLEGNPVAWDRVARGLPVLCAGDGLGLWVSTHRDDVGKFFAHAALNPVTFGQSYNATRQLNFTWRDLYRQTAQALGREAHLLFMPADWIVKHDPKRFNLLAEITRFHGPYTSAKALRDVPQFRCTIDYPEGASETLADIKRRNALKSSRGDDLYDSMVAQALSLGLTPQPA